MTACLVLGAAEVGATPQIAGQVADAAAQEASVADCSNDETRLGVARTVEIDTEQGANFGGSHGDLLGDHEVVLTFDDGPTRRTRDVLDALAGQCTKATFFMVGRMAIAHPELVKEVANAGHTVGLHTWSHLNQRALSLVRGIREIELGTSAVSRALGHPAAPFFRFPYLSANRRAADYVASRHMAAWWVDVDSKDYKTRNSKLVRERIMAQLAVRKKGIILMHDIQPSTVGAIRDLLSDLHANGYKVVHIVPKAPVSTVTTFDGEVEKLVAKKAAIAAANPLASRSVVWPMEPPSGAERAPASTTGGKGKVRGSSRPVVKAPKTRKPARQIAEQLPWRPTTFGY